MYTHGSTFTKYSITGFYIQSCCTCGVLFGLTNEQHDQLLKNKGKSFYCPNGHGQHYAGKSEAESLRERLEVQTQVARDRQAALDRERKRSAALKGENTKIKKRIKGGVCPCCNRSFVSLANHMKTQHPDFGNK
jgi:hypothetical protein